jgi:hypothetical protein
MRRELYRSEQPQGMAKRRSYRRFVRTIALLPRGASPACNSYSKLRCYQRHIRHSLSVNCGVAIERLLQLPFENSAREKAHAERKVCLPGLDAIPDV